MIELQVEDYCQECAAFEPEVRSAVIYNDNKIAERQTLVFCNHRNTCKHIYKTIERKFQNG